VRRQAAPRFSASGARDGPAVTGTLVNTAAVLAGSLVGLGLRMLKPDRPARPVSEPCVSGPVALIVMQGIGLVTVALGVRMALDGRHALVLILSIVLGGALGQIVGIERGLEQLAVRLRRITASSESAFVTGMVTASVLYCVGPMTILGSIQDGLQHDPKLLLIKSLMDGVSSVILASTLGVGVLFSALVVLGVQSLLTLLAAQLRFLTTPAYLNEFTAVGGLIILAIGIRLLGLRDVKAGNLLPGLAVVLLLVFLGLKLRLIN
jgi:hypothetical protein